MAAEHASGPPPPAPWRARRAPLLPERVEAFAPGRVNLIGEHTDYNRGLALPFAIAQGITVQARATGEPRVRAAARDLGESDDFALREPQRADGWRGFVRGLVAELDAAGYALRGAELQIEGDIARGAGLSSSAALAVALAYALIALGEGHKALARVDRRELARFCSRVENDWVGARTGLLDQLASLFGAPAAALCIDFATLAIEPVPLPLDGGWRLVTLDSGEAHTLASSGYNERREECARACELLGVESLREADAAGLAELPEVLARRVRHVLEENERVREAVAVLRAGALRRVDAPRKRELPPDPDMRRVGELLDAAHASLRDLYECSTPAVEAAVKTLKRAGAVGARMIGGGFGGHVLGLFPPGANAPAQAREVRPAAGARLLD